MFSNNDLTLLRALQEDNMPDRATIIRPTGVADSAGGQSDGETTVATNVRCRVRSSGRDLRARAVANRLGVAVAYVVAFPVGTNVQELDRISVIGWPSAFQVIAAPGESFETARMCDCIEART